MASPEIIDLATLLAPISEEAPAGIDIRQDSSPTSKYQQIKSARATAREIERKSISESESTEADEFWRKIMSLAPDILTSQSKDLEIASWYAEALVRRYGFQGMRDVFNLIRGLIENYWDNLYPMPDEDGMETRTAPLTGLNGEDADGVLIVPMRKIPLTEGNEPGPFSYWQYKQALDVQRAPDEATRVSKTEKLGFSLENIETAVAETSEVFFVNILDDVTKAIEYYQAISNLLDERCGRDQAPPTSKIINMLEECRGAINHLGKDKFPQPEEAEIIETVGENPQNPTATPAAKSGEVYNREVAFKQLIEIAKFFRKTEPHSPVSSVLEKAVKWGNMPLDELMLELIPDQGSRTHFSLATGIELKKEDD